MPTFVGSAIAHANGPGPFAPDLTGLASAGHLLIAKCFTFQDDADFTEPGWPTSDWWIFGYKTGNGTTCKVFYRFAPGTGSYSFTMTGSSAPSSVVVSVYSDVSPTNPFDGFSHIESFVNDATPTPPPFTSVTDDPLGVLWMGSTLGSTMTGGAPSGYSLGADYSGATYDDRQQFIATKDLTTPATETPGDWTHSASPGNTEDGYQLGMALQEPQGLLDVPTVVETILVNATIPLDYWNVGLHLDFGASPGHLVLVMIAMRSAGGAFSVTTELPGYTRIDSGLTGVTDKRMYISYQELGETSPFVEMQMSAEVYIASQIWYISNWNSAFPPVLVDAVGNDAGEVSAEDGVNLFIAACAGSASHNEAWTGMHGSPSGYNWHRQRTSPDLEPHPVSIFTGTKEKDGNAEDPGPWDVPGSNLSAVIAVRSGDTGGYLSGTQDGWGIPI